MNGAAPRSMNSIDEILVDKVLMMTLRLGVTKECLNIPSDIGCDGMTLALEFFMQFTSFAIPVLGQKVPR